MKIKIFGKEYQFEKTSKGGADFKCFYGKTIILGSIVCLSLSEEFVSETGFVYDETLSVYSYHKSFHYDGEYDKSKSFEDNVSLFLNDINLISALEDYIAKIINDAKAVFESNDFEYLNKEILEKETLKEII